MKSVLFSMKPRHCGDIAKLKKTREVRTTVPREFYRDLYLNSFFKPFKAFIYCTKNDLLWVACNKGQELYEGSGKVIGEFICNGIDKYLYEDYDEDIGAAYFITSDELEKACLSYEEVEEYGASKPLYFLHISDLVIYDKPRELTQFLQPCIHNFDIETCISCKNLSYNDLGGQCCDRRITRPPQSWCYVEEIKQQEGKDSVK